MKKDLKDRDLFKSIDYTPPVMKLAEVYPQDKKSPVRQCDDEKIIFDLSSINYIFVGLGLCGFILLRMTPEERIFYGWFIVFLAYGAKFGSLFVALYGLFGSRNKKYIFNRKDGTVTYPARGWFKSITQPFDETIFIMSQVGPFGNKGDDMLAILRPDGWTRSIINAEWVDKFFSLYVWYMDKNRPLPPGTAFDPYRERDYERRKGEGFPEPLYPAELNIVEHEGGRVEIIAAPKKPLGYGDLYFLKLKKEHRREKIIQAKKKQWIAQGLDADEEEQKERERYRKEKSREINEKKRKGELTSTEKYFWNMEEKEQKKKERNQKKEAWIAQGLDPRKEEKKEKKARQEQRERERRKKAGEHIPERKEENNTGPRMLRELKKRK